MNWKPNKIIAILLGMLSPPIGMLYINRAVWFWVYFFLAICAGMMDLWSSINSGTNITGSNYTVILSVVGVIHILFILRKNETTLSRPWFTKWYALLSLPVIFLVSVFMVRSFLYEPFRIPSNSMSPTLDRGTYFLAKKWGYGNYGTYGITLIRKKPSEVVYRGDVIVFEYPRKPSVDYIKRVIGLPGDIIVYDKDKLSINGVPVERNLKENIDGESIYSEILNGKKYFIKTVQNKNKVSGRVSVPNGHLFVMGDNRDNSNDSRYWGFVPYDNIVGKLAYVFE